MNYDLFIDTGAFFARYVARDQYHQQALLLWDRVRQERLSCQTTNFVLSELLTLICYRFGPKVACQVGGEIYHSNAIAIIPLTRDLELAALEWLERFQDQKFSMTDASAFALMEQEKISRAFTFDSHFKIAGFEMFQ